MNTLFDLDNPPRKSTRQIVSELKEAGQDFEFYPTTREMMEVVFNYISDWGEILDIGCGNGGFKRFLEAKGKNVTYYGIEKSEILLNQLPADVYILGTDFNNCTLIDKKVKIIFCNPPYSEYETWTKRIITEGNFKEAFLIIPERWQHNEEIQACLKLTKVRAYSGAEMDFFNAERQARAKINIVKLVKESSYSSNYVDPFELWFEKTFNYKPEVNYKADNKIEQKKEIKNKIVVAPNKIEALVNLYNDELSRLQNSFMAICALDAATLEDIGVNVVKVRESLKFKIENLKILYWEMIFDYLDEIKSRLTYESRNNLFQRFERLSQVDFNEANIRSVVIWVLKNAASLFDDQLIEFYKTFTLPDNIIKYKSNQKVFQKDLWYNRRFEKEKELSHYCLSYRLICDRFHVVGTKSKWNEKKKNYVDDSYIEEYKFTRILDDFSAIANNLGFQIASRETATNFGEKYYIMQPNGKALIEYKIYKNENIHLKLDIEFAKALNVEVARLLGWIRDKSDIAKEFPEEMAEGAEKYYNSNFSQAIMTTKIKLLTSN